MNMALGNLRLVFTAALIVTLSIVLYIQPRLSVTVAPLNVVENNQKLRKLCRKIDPELLRTQTHYRWVGNEREFVTMGSLLDRQTCVLCEAACKQATINRKSVSHRKKMKGRNIYWPKKLLGELSSIIQRRIIELQNPKDCSSAKKLDCTCGLKALGFGAQIHYVTVCLLIAYMTNRTLILNTKDNRYGNWERRLMPISTCFSKGCISQSIFRQRIPLEEMFNRSDETIIVPRHGRWTFSAVDFIVAIPEDIAFTLTLLDDDPSAWWTGQFTKYTLRLRPDVEAKLRLELSGPMAGLHIRRGDKLKREGGFHSNDEYMLPVNNFYNSMAGSKPKRVFVATVEDNVFEELENKYPSYTFIYNRTLAARPKSSLLWIVHDLYLLSQSEFVVCTITSNICQVLYELQHANGDNVTASFSNIEGAYGLKRRSPTRHVYIATQSYISRSIDCLNISVGDTIERGFFTGNVDIYFGWNRNTGKKGYFQIETMRRVWPLININIYLDQS